MTFALFAPESHDRINFSALGERAAPPAAVGDAVGVGVQSRRRVLRVVRPSRERGQKGLKEYFYGRQKEEGGEGGREGEGMREFLARGRPPHARNTPTGTGTGWPNRICIIICGTQIRFIRYQHFPRPCLHGLCSASPSRAVGVTAMLRKTYFIIHRTCRGRPRPCACRRRRLCVPSFLRSFGAKTKWGAAE